MKKFWKSNKKAIKFILFVFIVWQLVVFLASSLTFSLTGRILPARERFMYNDGKEIINPPSFWKRANFDGTHYLQISRYGYGLYQQAFFPLYPKLISFFTPLFGGKDLLVGILISNVSFLVFLFFLYKLVRLDFSDLVAKRTLIFFLVFPTSFFLGMVYTEGLFLMLAIGSFYTARKGNWLVAGILGALASYTRLVGIFLFPALVWECYQRYKIQNTRYPPSPMLRRAGKIQNLLPLFLVPIGLLTYMKFLRQKYGDPLMFLHVQPFFGAERSGGKIILLYQVFWRYLKMILTTRWDPLYFAVWLELLSAIGFLILFVLAFKKGIRVSYLIFSILSFLAPTISGTFSSLPRYVLTMFPCFIFLGLIKNKTICNILWTIFGLIFIISSIFFFRGYWVA